MHGKKTKGKSWAGVCPCLNLWKLPLVHPLAKALLAPHPKILRAYHPSLPMAGKIVGVIDLD